MKTPATLYIADDHQIVIDGLKMLIGNDETFRIIGTANDTETARTEIISKKPDLALVDLRMPKEKEGLDMIFSLLKTARNTRFVILSMHSEQHYMRDALNRGVSGYLLKNANKEDLKKCLTTVLKGESYFPNLVPVKGMRDQSLFTPREVQILKLILEGLTTAKIADRLSLALHTVVTHRKNICRKTRENTPLGFSKFLKEHHIEL